MLPGILQMFYVDFFNEATIQNKFSVAGSRFCQSCIAFQASRHQEQANRDEERRELGARYWRKNRFLDA